MDKIDTPKNKYLALVFTPIIAVVLLIVSIYQIPGMQTMFLSFFDQCKQLDIIGSLQLTTLGIAMIMLMMPFAFYEFAIGYSCSSYLVPILIVTAAKVIGETLSFFIGLQLTPILRPILREFKFFRSIEVITRNQPFKAQLLMRLSGITPQLIMNYGMGVIGNIDFGTFFLVANISGIPSTILAVFIGKQLNNLRGIILLPIDIFNDHKSSNQVQYIELSVCLVAILSVGMIVYHVGKEYKKIIEENFSVLDNTLESTKGHIEVELENGI